MKDNEDIIITYNTLDFNPNEIGVILIAEDGSFLYGKVNKKYQNDYKNRIKHENIFGECSKDLGIELSSSFDNMKCAWYLAKERNIVNLQIIPVKNSSSVIVIVMDTNRTNEQEQSLNFITAYFAEKKCLFNADVFNCDGKISIYNESSTTNEYDLDFETFNNRLAEILLKSSKLRK